MREISDPIEQILVRIAGKYNDMVYVGKNYTIADIETELRKILDLIALTDGGADRKCQKKSLLSSFLAKTVTSLSNLLTHYTRIAKSIRIKARI